MPPSGRSLRSHSSCVPCASHREIGTIAIVLTGAMFLTLIGAGMVRFSERTESPRVLAAFGVNRTPMFIILGLWLLVGGSIVTTGNNVQLVESTDPESDRLAAGASIDSIWERWVERNGAGLDGSTGVERSAIPMVLVSSSGGGARASVWTSYVLDCLFERDPGGAVSCGDRREPPEGRSSTIALMSGVSGGGLGIAGYSSYLADPSDAAGEDWVKEKMGTDSLSPAMAWLMYVDLPRALIGLRIRNPGSCRRHRVGVGSAVGRTEGRSGEESSICGTTSLSYPPSCSTARVSGTVAASTRRSSRPTPSRRDLRVWTCRCTKPAERQQTGGCWRPPRTWPTTCAQAKTCVCRQRFISPHDSQSSQHRGVLAPISLTADRRVASRTWWTAGISRDPHRARWSRYGARSRSRSHGTTQQRHRNRASFLCLFHIDNGYEEPAPAAADPDPGELLLPVRALAGGQFGRYANARQSEALEFSRPFSAGGSQVTIRTADGRCSMTATYASRLVPIPASKPLSVGVSPTPRSTTFAINSNLPSNRREIDEVRTWLDGALTCSVGS